MLGRRVDDCEHSVSDRLAEMFELQYKLQQSFGAVPDRMAPRERIQYVKDMVLAATIELGEVLNETQWKPWARGSSRINVDAYVGELVDVWHFLMNLLLAAGYEPTDAADKLYEGYLIKRGVNERRAADDYDGVSTKCVSCHRALDDSAVACWRRGDQGYCGYENVDINFITTSKGNHGVVTTPHRPSAHS
jgi:hypothetical protein